MNNIFPSACKATSDYLYYRKTYGSYLQIKVVRMGKLRIMQMDAVPISEFVSITLDQEDIPSVRQAFEGILTDANGSKWQNAGFYIDPTSGLNLKGYHKSSYNNSNGRDGVTPASTSTVKFFGTAVYYV